MSFRLSERLWHAEKGHWHQPLASLGRCEYIRVSLHKPHQVQSPYNTHGGGSSFLKRKNIFLWFFSSRSIHRANSISVFRWFWDAHFNIQRQGYISYNWWCFYLVFGAHPSAFYDQARIQWKSVTARNHDTYIHCSLRTEAKHSEMWWTDAEQILLYFPLFPLWAHCSKRKEKSH